MVAEIFDSNRYMPLEATKESLFGEIILSDHSTFFDFDMKSIFVFNKSGKNCFQNFNIAN